MLDENKKRETLNELRDELDKIDCQVHDLLMARAELVSRIKKVKRLESIATIRPGREAAILRRLIERHQGDFPKGAIARIWREIIAGITRMEMPSYNIAVYATDTNQTYWDLARDQFGILTPMKTYSHMRDVLDGVLTGNATLGVIPIPDAEKTEPWWISLMVPDGLKIAYKLPFFGKTNARSNSSEPANAFAVGRILPDPTEDDRTLVVLVTEEPKSRSAVCNLTKRVGLPSSLITSSQQGDWFHLVEITGFITNNDKRMASLNNSSTLLRSAIIGSYAEPLTTTGC